MSARHPRTALDCSVPKQVCRHSWAWVITSQSQSHVPPSHSHTPANIHTSIQSVVCPSWVLSLFRPLLSVNVRDINRLCYKYSWKVPRIIVHVKVVYVSLRGTRHAKCDDLELRTYYHCSGVRLLCPGPRSSSRVQQSPQTVLSERLCWTIWTCTMPYLKTKRRI